MGVAGGQRPVTHLPARRPCRWLTVALIAGHHAEAGIDARHGLVEALLGQRLARKRAAHLGDLCLDGGEGHLRLAAGLIGRGATFGPGTPAGVELGSITDRMQIRQAVQGGHVEEAIDQVNDLNPEVNEGSAEGGWLGLCVFRAFS